MFFGCTYLFARSRPNRTKPDQTGPNRTKKIAGGMGGRIIRPPRFFCQFYLSVKSGLPLEPPSRMILPTSQQMGGQWSRNSVWRMAYSPHFGTAWYTFGTALVHPETSKKINGTRLWYTWYTL